MATSPITGTLWRLRQVDPALDGAIHRAAGPELLAACRVLNGCATGDARITRGYRLPARRVIHAVGPVWRDGQHGEDAALASCYRRCFALASQHAIATIAFPSISTGAYRFPVERAARIALTETRRVLETGTGPRHVVCVCFDRHTFEIYRQEWDEQTARATR